MFCSVRFSVFNVFRMGAGFNFDLLSHRLISGIIRGTLFLYSEYIKLIIKISTPKIITLKHMIFDKLLKKLIKIEREPTNIKPNIKFRVL